MPTWYSGPQALEVQTYAKTCHDECVWSQHAVPGLGAACQGTSPNVCDLTTLSRKDAFGMLIVAETLERMDSYSMQIPTVVRGTGSALCHGGLKFEISQPLT